ncbi:MAG: nuclear transport factor 2 family protein [Steroidobacteraceae bacterium]|jgi:hypothetical protein|nr:nuclear transport factor 2 family protein [Steroidobacteraceae bacterium]
MNDTARELALLADRVAALEHEVGRHRDLAAIHEVLHRYARALDWLDDALLDTVFFDDAAIDYGFFRGSGREFRPLLMQVERTYGRRWHFTSQVEIHLAGDRADVRSYNLSVASVPVSPVPPADLGMFYGWYVDRMEKREGRWGIAARKHLLLAGTSVREIALDGPMAVLNQVGEATPAHPDYLRG